MADKDKDSSGKLADKHKAGKELYLTFRDIRNKDDWNYSEYRLIARRWLPEDEVEDWTNVEGDGYIDLAEDKGINLKEDKHFQKEFWRLIEHGFADQMDTEDQDVQRGFRMCDGLIRLGGENAREPGET